MFGSRRSLRNTVVLLALSSLSLASTECLFAKSLVVHEWGTFTSLQNSKGENMLGMHHEESQEPLPSFVYGRADLLNKKTGDELFGRPRCPRGSKCVDFNPELFEVTQKMETPVIYFYTSDAQDVSVTVDFPNGVISQWYPQASKFTPELGKVDALSGSMSWNVSVSPTVSDLPRVEKGSIWEPSRIPNSSYVTAGTEHEKLIFYRGLGNFDAPVHITSQGSQLHIESMTTLPVEEVLLLSFDGKRGYAQELKLQTNARGYYIGDTTAPRLNEQGVDTQTYVRNASDILRSHLMKAKLTFDEANALIGTWEKSYFTNTGLRVLYIVPRKITDELLPISIKPSPDSLERVMVARVEIMTQAEEQNLFSELKSLVDAGNEAEIRNFIQRLGRIAEAKLLRLFDLDTSNGLRDLISTKFGSLYR